MYLSFYTLDAVAFNIREIPRIAVMTVTLSLHEYDSLKMVVSEWDAGIIIKIWMHEGTFPVGGSDYRCYWILAKKVETNYERGIQLCFPSLKSYLAFTSEKKKTQRRRAKLDKSEIFVN